MSHRRARLGAVLLGLALVLPSIGAGFLLDDYLQIAQLEGWSLNPAGPLDLYSFVPRDRARVAELRRLGSLPYFVAPDLRMSFARPLSSALTAFDHALFGRRAWPYHVHTLLWYAALLLVVAAVLRRSFDQHAAPLATLALLIFCLDDGHALTVTFIAARNAAVSCALVWLGLWAHLRWRTSGWRAGAWLAPLLGALGLAAGEMGLAALAYLVAWEICERRHHWQRALMPTVLLVAAYLVTYRTLGLGAHGSGEYLDPFGDPRSYLAALPARLLLLFGSLVLRTPIDFAMVDQRLRAPLMLAGAAAAVMVALWLPRALRRMRPEESAAVRWMGLGAAGALFAATPGLLGERLVFAASLGGAVVVAALLRDAWRLFRARRARVLAGAALVTLGLPSLALAAVALPAKTIFFGRAARADWRLARDAEIAAPVPAQVVIVALDDLFAVDLPVIRAFAQHRSPAELRDIIRGRPPAGPDTFGAQGTTVLSMASVGHRLRRTASDTLELSTPEGTLLDGVWPATVRAPNIPLPRGAAFRTARYTATVLEDRGGRPTRVAFQFDRPLEDPSLVFLTLRDRGLRRLALPPIGGELTLPKLNPFELVQD